MIVNIYQEQSGNGSSKNEQLAQSHMQSFKRCVINVSKQTKHKNQREDKQVNGTSKFKTFMSERTLFNGKTTHKMGENVWKSFVL